MGEDGGFDFVIKFSKLPYFQWLFVVGVVLWGVGWLHSRGSKACNVNEGFKLGWKRMDVSDWLVKYGHYVSDLDNVNFIIDGKEVIHQCKDRKVQAPEVAGAGVAK